MTISMSEFEENFSVLDDAGDVTVTLSFDPVYLANDTLQLSHNITSQLSHNSTRPLRSSEICVIVLSESAPWNNPDDLITYNASNLVRDVVLGILLPILLLINTPANTLCMVVFYRQGLRERVNFCLFLLSFLDLFYTIQCFVHNADRLYLIILGEERFSSLTQFYVNNRLIGFYGLHWASSFMTTVIACDRCFCVFSPLHSQDVIRTRTMAIVSVTSCAIITGGSFFIAFRWSVGCIFDPLTNTTSHANLPSAFFLQHRQAVDILDGTIYGLVIPCFCCTVVMVTTTVTVVKLKELANWRGKSSSSSAWASSSTSVRDVTLTRMLVGMSIVYIVLAVPGICFRVAILSVPDLNVNGRYYNTFNVLIFINTLCMLPNSSINFLVYYTLGSKFRESVKSILKVC